MNVTTHPTAKWTALQLTQAFPFDTAPRFIIRDRDGIYGDAVRRAIASLGSEGLAKDSPAGRTVEPSELGPTPRG